MSDISCLVDKNLTLVERPDTGCFKCTPNILVSICCNSGSCSSAKVQIDYRLRYAHTRTRAAHCKLPVDPCATHSL